MVLSLARIDADSFGLDSWSVPQFQVACIRDINDWEAVHNFRQWRVVAVNIAAVAFLLLLSPAAVHAQGCAMCYQSAASSGAKMIAALRHGILLLMFPPLLIFSGIIGLAYSRRNSFAESPDGSADTEANVKSNEIEISLND
jgi:hypothetical protein